MIKLCRKCGIIKRFAEFSRERSRKDGLQTACKSCVKKRKETANYPKQTKEQAREYARKRRNKDRDAFNKRRRELYQKKSNKERIQQEHKRWVKNNPESIKARTNRRRALARNAQGDLSPTALLQRFSYYGNCCYYCGCDGKMQIEHRIPLSRGGSNHPSNIVPACPSCNNSKGTMTEREYKAKLCS